MNSARIALRALDSSVRLLPATVSVDENCDGNLGDCAPCFAWKNHGEYVRCVAHAVESVVVGGYLSEEACDELVSAAARSQVGKKGYTAPGCESL